MQRTWNPKIKKRLRIMVFLNRMSSLGGRKVLAKRRSKGRKKLTVIKKG
jgi:large subunit ribosomal protein L34